ncbi:retrovirus-related pol polyprotein from transposon TNT 1-94 [Tanacetum coccineum]|uniref:Retrovirus-related pol polyprotein from transposon TNT 1-94 n=1 Tax=Tanacetum coccineum TaxID=301880 RepID=A0ABQ5HCY1_9ASTR
MTIFPDISRRARDAYHNLQDDDIMKNIFNSGRNKNKVGMSETSMGMHRTPSAPRSPNSTTETTESSVPKRSTMIRFRLPLSLAEHKSREEQEARENVALVYEHLAAKEIEKLVEDHENEKEEETTKKMKVEPDKDIPMVDVTNIVIPVNVDDEEDEITDEVFKLRRRVKRKNVEENYISPIPSPTRSPRNLSTLVSSDTEKLQELTVTQPTPSSEVMEQVKKEVPAQVRDQVPVYLEEGLILERKTTKEETKRLISKAILQERGRMQAQWNSHKKTIGNEAAYAMSWTELMKLMTEVYCLRNEIQKMETELWNLTVKGNDLTVYTQRFQELILLCTRMVPNEEDIVDRFIGGF